MDTLSFEELFPNTQRQGFCKGLRSSITEEAIPVYIENGYDVYT